MSTTDTGVATASPEGVVVPPTTDTVVSVWFDDQQVWAFHPVRDGRLGPDGRSVAWPDAMATYLHGRTRVRLVEFASQRELGEREVVFDDAPERVRLADKQGRPLMVNKVGTLSRGNDAAGADVRRELLLLSARLLDVLRGPGGVEAFLCYGALLGAVREHGRMIGHDCDVDLVYLSDHRQPVDVVAESYRVERAVRAAGWATVRMSAADFKVKLPLADGRVEAVDVFAGFHVGERYYQLGNRSGTLAREDLVPTGTVLLEGVELPAPRRPERMLAFLYGPHWQVPDPSFRYADPPDGVRRLDGWLRGFRTEQPPWNRFYESPAAEDLPRRGSELARWVLPHLPAGSRVADLGCGGGRDSAYFARRGHVVRSLDCSPRARARTRRLLRRRSLPGDVVGLQLGELRQVLAEGLLLRGSVLYARQLLDCVDDTGRDHFFRLAAVAGGPAFVEFSSGRGPSPQPGLRRRLDADAVVAAARARGGSVVSRYDGPGLDMFDQPDPMVTRLHLDFAQEQP